MTQKKGILLVSFGTSYLDSKEKTIDLILEDVKKAFPQYYIYQAWTSKTILHILKTRDNLSIFSLEEAMEKIKADGIDSLTVQPTHLINGLENDVMVRTIQAYSSDNFKISFGAPLLSSTEDQKSALTAVLSDFSSISKEEALVLMGHGTTHHANSIYAALDYMLKEMGHPNVLIGTVEAYPGLDTLIRQVAKLHPKRVHLLPFMLVAGDHANNDMAGEQPDSWKSLFEAAGYEVLCHLKGLGENKGIRKIYLEHLREAMDN